MYQTQEEARQKLGSSVVLYDGAPVYVLTTRDGDNRDNYLLGVASLPLKKRPRELASSDLTYIPVKDAKWDFKGGGYRLGYSSFENPQTKEIETVFSSRVPSRHPRQGLDSQTVFVRLYGDAQFPVSFDNLVYSEGLVSTIQGKFLGTDKAFEHLTKEPEKYHSVPISRKLLLSYDKVTPPTLVYRQEKIGYTEDGKTFKLAAHKAFLKEELQDIQGLKIA